MKRSTLLMAFALAFGLMAAEVRATWRQIDSYFLPIEKEVEDAASRPWWAKSAWAQTWAGETSGAGEAFATSPTQAVTWTVAPPNGLATSFWMHFPPGVGEVEVIAEAEIACWAEAFGPGVGKAAAFGYAEAAFFINGVATIVIVKANSAVATSAVQGLPSFQISIPVFPGGPGVAITQAVTFHNGTGRVPDAERSRRFRVACPVAYFETRERSRATIFVWALGAGSKKRGRSACEIEGEARVNYYLLTHYNGCPNK